MLQQPSRSSDSVNVIVSVSRYAKVPRCGLIGSLTSEASLRVNVSIGALQFFSSHSVLKAMTLCTCLRCPPIIILSMYTANGADFIELSSHKSSSCVKRGMKEHFLVIIMKGSFPSL